MTRMSPKKRREAIAGHLFLLPSNVLAVVFMILPLIYAIYLSFFKYNGFSAKVYIGWENYLKLFTDPNFYASLKNVLIYVAIVVPGLMISSLAIAATLASKFRNKFGEVVRITMFIPVLCSLALVGSIFFFIFSSSSDGLINTILQLFGFEKVNWLGQRETALPVICLVSIWKNLGYYIVYFYAGIMDIPKDYYEAARIDGATPLQQFFRITLPCLKPILYLVLLLLTISSFQVFELPYTMTSGGPGNATMMPGYLIYNYAFNSRRMGYASAYAMIVGIIIFAVSILQRVVMREKVGDEE